MAPRLNASGSLHIRLATGDDVAAMVGMINAAFAIETFIDGSRTDERGLAEMMGKGGFLVAEDQSGRLVASVYTELRGERGYFGMLAVDPAQQGTGLGRVMVKAAEDHCRSHGCKHMDITVLSLRTELPPFYRKLGYLETGTEEFHPHRPLRNGVACHCILMSKRL